MIADPIAEEGIDLLQEHADVDVKISLSREELLDSIADYDALVVRSNTLITPENHRSRVEFESDRQGRLGT